MVNGKPLVFDFYGLYNGVVTMFDTGSESVWLQVEGRAVKGPLTGTRLKRGELLQTTWGKWRQLHPDTLVMTPDKRYGQAYSDGEMLGPPGFRAFPAPYFATTVTHTDDRLPMFTMVYAVSIEPADSAAGSPAVSRAYPVSALKSSGGVLADTLNRVPIVVLYDAAAKAAVALEARIDGRKIEVTAQISPSGDLEFADKLTGSHFTLEGEAIDGPLKGKRLKRLNGYMSEWYGWVSYFPHTSIYGQPDSTTPQPGPADGQKPGGN